MVSARRCQENLHRRAGRRGSLNRRNSVQGKARLSTGNSGNPTATTLASSARVRSISAEVVAAVSITGEPFLWDVAFPRAASIRAAKAINRAHQAQQPIEQSPVDAQQIRAAAARAPHASPVRGRRGGHRLADSADLASPWRTPLPQSWSSIGSMRIQPALRRCSSVDKGSSS